MSVHDVLNSYTHKSKFDIIISSVNMEMYRILGSNFDLCRDFIILSDDVYDFIKTVDGINEESITDYLLWQLKKINNRYKRRYQFDFIKLNKFSKKDENEITGADFELEFWIINRKKQIGIPLVIQAKKFIKDHDDCCRKLNYKSKTQQQKGERQIDLLIDYCKRNKKLPFYLIYTLVDYNKNTTIMQNYICVYAHFVNALHESRTFKASMLLIDAIKIKKIADNCLNENNKLYKKVCKK